MTRRRGILILVINMLGGLAHRHDGSRHVVRSDAARVYTLLAIGDGLVAQIPALLLSTAVAIIVTRVSSAQDMGGGVVEGSCSVSRVRWRSLRACSV